MQLITRARRLDYRILLVFVALDSVELHVKRVLQRVLNGGHHIPEEIIRRRYDQSFRNLSLAIPECDDIVIFDNSGPVGPQSIIEIEGSRIVGNRLSKTNSFHDRIAATVAAGLGVLPATLLDRD